MRSLGLVVVLAACSDGGDGAVLSFTAPEGPGTASRIEVVLASPSDDALTETSQRKRPGDLGEEPVVYYRQRATVDAILGLRSVNGFEVRIEPDATIVPDEAFIPFALIYDAEDTLIGVGSVNDAEGEPTSVMIKPGVVASYEVTVLPIAPDVDAGGIKDGEGHAVSCGRADEPWHSGAVWKRAGKPQLRLLFPDLAMDPDATDAMERDSDLDCDQHATGDHDCDDLRSAYHPGAAETCDGADTDCDGRRQELVTDCTSPTNAACSATGVSLCTEEPGAAARPGLCQPTAACGCAATTGGTIPQNCAQCSMNWTFAPNGASPCSPSTGKLHFDSCVAPGCTVELVGATGPWELKISAEENGTFGGRLTGVTLGYFYLRAKYLGTMPFTANAPSVGAAYVSISTASGSWLMPINLALESDGGQCAATGNNFMRCIP